MNLRDFAEFYRSKGLTILPVNKNKQCLLEDWSNKTPQELEAHVLNGSYEGVGIRLEGLTVVDIEDRRLVKVLFDEDVEELARKTWVSKTGRGYHIYFKGKVKPVQADGLAELRSTQGKYVVAPPSPHPSGCFYEWVSDIHGVEIAEVKREDLEKLRRKIELLHEFRALVKELSKSKIWVKDHRHNISLYLSGALRKRGYTYEEAETVLKAIAYLADDEEVDDRLKALETTNGIENDAEVAGESYLKQELEAIVGPDEAERILKLLPRRNSTKAIGGDGVKEEKSILSLHIPNRNLALEAIGVKNGLDEYDPKLLILGPQGFEIRDHMVVDRVKITPRPSECYPYAPYEPSPADHFDVKTREELARLAKAEVDRFIAAENGERAVFAAYILLSYVQESFNTLPYLYLVGDNNSGKSHLLELFNFLCYRPLYGVCDTPASIYTYLGGRGTPPQTILEDEFQGSEKDTDKMKIYKAGYRKGAKVTRVDLDKGRREDYFNVFGLKAMAAEEKVDNRGLLERCIVVEMVEGEPEKDNYEDEKDLERFKQLRWGLLKWRMNIRIGGEKLPTPNLEWLKGRNRQLFLPLLTVVEGTQLYPLVESYVRETVERRKRERSNNLEAFVCRAAIEFMENKKTNELRFGEFWDKICNDLGVTTSTSNSRIIDSRGVETEAYGFVSKAKVSHILTDKLGFEKIKTRRNGTPELVFRPDKKKLERAARKYCVNIPLDLFGDSEGHRENNQIWAEGP